MSAHLRSSPARAAALASEPDRFHLPAPEAVLDGLAAPAAPLRERPLRDVWLRLTLVCTLVGAVLMLIYGWMWSSSPLLAAPAVHHVWISALALVAVLGVLVLERAAAAGMVLLLASLGLGITSGAVWLAPGALFGCVWAIRHSAGARVTLGMLLLIPGAAAGWLGTLALAGYKSQMHLGLLPAGLDPPSTLAQALRPLSLLPLALLGAWMLVARGE